MSYHAYAATKRSDIPSQRHWAIVEFDSIYVPGDQRSRDCPGHGYPEHTETTVSYRAFLKREDWEEEIARRKREDDPYRKDNWIAIEAHPATITTKVQVSVNTSTDEDSYGR